MLTFATLFSGVEGWGLGAEAAGCGHGECQHMGAEAPGGARSRRVVIACPSCSAPTTRVLELEAVRAKLACRVCGAQWHEVVVPIPEAAKE